MISICNGFLMASFDAKSGDWVSLRRTDGTQLLGRPGLSCQVFIDRQPFPASPFPEQRQRKLSQCELTDDGRGCRMIFESEGLRVTQTITLDAKDAVLRQSVRIACIAGTGPRLLSGIHYFLPGFVVGQPAQCKLQAPSQHIAPDMSYEQAAALALDRRVDQPLPGYPQGWLRSSPDEGPGLVIVENPNMGQVASAWLYCEKANTFVTLDGHDGLLDLEFQHKFYAWLRPGDVVESEGFCLLGTKGTLETHLAEFRKICYGEDLKAAGDTPDWVDDIRLFQIAPYPLAPWFDRLKELREMGFNLLYLTPVWKGRWYVLDDHFQIQHQVGTAEELKQFVAQAHACGIRVIFDLIPQGCGGDNPIVRDHPDWLVRDELSRPFGSHGWGPRPGAPYDGHTYSMDWGNPEYRKYIVDWAVWNVREFDIDGFRTDALHWKEPNLSPGNPRPAWHTTLGGAKLAEEVRTAIKRVKPEVFLLSELAGPIFSRSHDAVYENNWLVGTVTEGWLNGIPYFTARQWCRYLALAKEARPDGSRRALFTATHDLVHLANAARNSLLGDAVSFCHLFSDGIPFVMWDEIAGREAFFRKLMAMRAELKGYDCHHRGMTWNNENLFCALWIPHAVEGMPRLAVANLSQHTITDEVTITKFNSFNRQIQLNAGQWQLLSLDEKLDIDIGEF